MRIVGGSARGRRLLVPSAGTRPTSGRAREALFNRLETILEVDGARVLDLYAGSGAVGLEALSRGASYVQFVESDRKAAALIARNLHVVLGPFASAAGDRSATRDRSAAGDRGATRDRDPTRAGDKTDPGQRSAIDARPVRAAIATAPPGGPFDLVFADPPYAVSAAEINSVVASISTAQWLVDGGVVVVERSVRTDGPSWPAWVEPLTAKRYGEGVLWYGRTMGN